MYKITISYKDKALTVIRPTREQLLRDAEDIALAHFPEEIAMPAIIIAYSSVKLSVMRETTIRF